MLSGRNPRAISGRAVGGLTKTQQLRQAKSSAFVQEYEQKQEKIKRPEDVTRRRKYERPEPKKVDFSKPTMTKTMLARMKHAEKFKEDYERKKEDVTQRPKRTPAPIGGDARMGKEKISRKLTPSSSTFASPTRDPSASRQPTRKSLRAQEGLSAIPEKTCELARSMNADVIQAEPLGEGLIENIIIPPGTVSDDRTTVISIVQPPFAAELPPSSQIANRSIQVISETLNEQDAAEAAAVQNRLADLQQARREFVITIANVGGNAVNVGEETSDHGRTRLHRTTAQRPPVPRTPPRRLYKVPDIEDEQFQVKYGLDHPDVAAAREFAQRTMAGLKDREAAQRMEREFERMSRLPPADDLQLDVPFEEQLYQDEDISWEEDEETGMTLPRPSRIKATATPVPKRHEFYQHEPFDPEQLEKFFDLEQYPPAPPPCRPPTGRECLHPDLWELDDPWYRPPPEPDVPDLIEFD